MNVSVVVVTYNSSEFVRDCMDSVRVQAGSSVEIIAVDNASADGTADVVRASGSGVTLLTNRENIGFGRACNQGFAASSGRFVYFLNPDAQLVQRDALARLCRAMDEHLRWGLAGTRILSSDGQVVSPPNTSYPGQSRARNNFAGLPGHIAWILGASMFFRREAFAEVGGFDPDFFLYGEETDLCLRLRQKGHEIGFLGDLDVRHVGGASEQGRDPYEVWTRRMNGIHRFWKKHYAPEDAARLVRRDLVRARYRMFVNDLLAKLQPPRAGFWQKYRRYQAIWETSARFLSAK